ncbi:MAG TPA: TOBE domain-containing protein, partial [Candidatus Dormibacteraeota bacterium]|nr:TOBE domain-containing protein [Candidatus Dormibacteraeota bacterium]
FLFDEPISSLDAKLRAQTRLELQKHHRKLGATFVYVTHDQVEAMTLGDRIAVMKDGILEQVGPPREIFDHPANKFVAGFIGSPTMNFVPVTVDGMRAKASGFELMLPLAPRVGRAILGLRAESLSPRLREGDPVIDLRVDLSEILGPDQLVYGAAGADSLVARVDPGLRVSPGDQLRLGIDVQRLHLFDESTGKTLW